MPRALLIEDEATARADLRQKLAAHPAITVIAEAATMRSARELLARTDYDLVFLDIQLIGGNAFDLVPDVRPGASIIFVTAFDSYTLRAFEINALDYLLKPVTPERLALSVARLGSAAPSPHPGDANETGGGPAPDTELTLGDTLYLRSGQRARFAPVADISVISAQDNYSEVWLVDGSRVFLRKSLKAWEAHLPASHFMRVHRTQIVNLAHVTDYERDADEHTLLCMRGGPQTVGVSRYRWGEFRQRLETIRRVP